MSPWESLVAELDRWRAAGRAAAFWWRDDDAVEPTAALDRLLALRRGRDVPLALAVVPARATAGLARALDGAGLTVLQHGYAHIDHEAGGARKSEFGPSRARAAALGELAAGAARLRGLFGARALPVLAPPWNRISPTLLPHLPGLGYKGISMFSATPPGPEPQAMPQGLRRVDTHLDIIDWRGGRGFIGERRALEGLVAHLAARRTRSAPADEPTGLLTHHLVHDDECHAFLETLLDVLDEHGAARWVSARALFPADP